MTYTAIELKQAHDEKTRPYQRGLMMLAKYPPEEYHRLVVDGKLEVREKGWMRYENRQPGCLRAMFNGWAVAISNLQEPTLTKDLIFQIHAACISNVHRLNHNGGLRTEPQHGVGFDFEPEILTEEGLLELLQIIADQKNCPEGYGSWVGKSDFFQEREPGSEVSYHLLQQKLKENNCSSLEELAKKLFAESKEERYAFHPPRPGEAFDKKFQGLIDNYNTAIRLVQDDDSKLKIIVDLVYEMEHLHPFFDANLRTFVILLLNRLLIQNGFLVATLYEPNFFDGHSKQELLGVVKAAMEVSRKIINGEKNIFGVNTADFQIDPSLQVYYREAIFPFFAVLHQADKHLLLATELSNYLGRRNIEDDYKSFWGRLSGMGKKVKFNAVKKLQQLLEGAELESPFTDDELTALHDGRLGNILAKYSEVRPKELLDAEHRKDLKVNRELR